MTYDPKSFLQQLALRDLGYYRGALDGLWGEVSARAYDAWLNPVPAETSPVRATYDDRTEANIATLCPKAQEAARRFMASAIPAMAAHGLTVKIISGTRTYAEQDAIYAQGRTKPGPKVTNAPGGYSNHNFGIAWDIGLFDAQGHYLPESTHYRECAKIAIDQGLDSGAVWTNLPDEPHIQLVVPWSLSQLRDRKAQGLPIC